MVLDDANERSVEGDENVYCFGTIPVASEAGRGSHSVVVTTALGEKGNIAAATITTQMLNTFRSIRDVMLVGIAGGVPRPSGSEYYVSLGDVVVSQTDVIQYDMLRITTSKVEITGSPVRASARLVNAARRALGAINNESLIVRMRDIHGITWPHPNADVEYSADTQDAIVLLPDNPNPIPESPRIHLGRIGSADILIRDPDLRDLIATYTNILAFEMEGSGVAFAAWKKQVGFMIVRGISDYGDSNKSDHNVHWRTYATRTAAEIARLTAQYLALSKATPTSRR
jgi:nucleoside phosphorylase